MSGGGRAPGAERRPSALGRWKNPHQPGSLSRARPIVTPTSRVARVSALRFECHPERTNMGVSSLVFVQAGHDLFR